MASRPTTPTRRMLLANRLQIIAVAFIGPSALIPLALAFCRVITPQSAGWLSYAGLAVATVLALVSWPLERR